MTSTDNFGVAIQVDDFVRVLAWGAPVRLADTGKTTRVTGFTPAGNVRLADTDIAGGRAVSPGLLGVLADDGSNLVAAGYVGNLHLYTCCGTDSKPSAAGSHAACEYAAVTDCPDCAGSGVDRAGTSAAHLNACPTCKGLGWVR